MKVQGKPLTPEILDLFSEHGILQGVWVPGNGTIIANYGEYIVTFSPKFELFVLVED